MTEKKKQKFLRRTWSRYSKLGKGRKKKQKWRRPTGRDKKMREKRKGYPVVVSIGYKKTKEQKTKSIIISNLKDLEKVKKDNTIIIGKVGKKKKIEIAKKAKEKNLQFFNLNPEKFLKQVEKKTKKKVEEKSKKSKADDKKEKEKKEES